MPIFLLFYLYFSYYIIFICHLYSFSNYENIIINKNRFICLAIILLGKQAHRKLVAKDNHHQLYSLAVIIQNI